ncbi:hypothetical protein HDU67_005419 [Dinochytrium kinnereticum]|nr:hypothetical protein HDU67_005419 [Dinochytrium kinnereticum]
MMFESLWASLTPFQKVTLFMGFDARGSKRRILVLLKPHVVERGHEPAEEEVFLEIDHHCVMQMVLLKGHALASTVKAKAPFLSIVLPGSLCMICYSQEAESVEAAEQMLTEAVKKMKSWISGATTGPSTQARLVGGQVDPSVEELKDDQMENIGEILSVPTARSVETFCSIMDSEWKNIEKALHSYRVLEDPSAGCRAFSHALSQAIVKIEDFQRGYTAREKELGIKREEVKGRYDALWTSNKVPSEAALSAVSDEMSMFMDLQARLVIHRTSLEG